MSTTKHTGSPEEQATNRLGEHQYKDERLQHRCEGEIAGYAVCLRERAIPAEREVETLRAENERLRKALQVSVDAIRSCSDCDGSGTVVYSYTPHGEPNDIGPCPWCHQYAPAIAAAKELNVTPTER